jgi:ABC-type transport system involved in multi-copper enzyme maturation permease subunit
MMTITIMNIHRGYAAFMIITITIIIPIITLIFTGTQVFLLTTVQASILVITGGILITLITAHRGTMAVIGMDTGMVITAGGTTAMVTMVTDTTTDIITDTITGVITTIATIHTTEIPTHIRLTDRETAPVTEDVIAAAEAVVRHVRLLRQEIRRTVAARLPNVTSVLS